jgi:CRISPR type I-D-associated protein Csc2
MDTLNPFLADIEHLTDTSSDGKQEYIHPALKNLGSVSLVVIRETIAPTVFRNAEEEITDIEVGESVHVRAVPNKLKYPEKGRGLQILRAYGVGGKHPQNRTALREKQSPSEAFDLNTLVFGDSTTQGQRVLPVKAAVNYSDALSLLPKHLCVDETFHNRAAEDGTLFDAAEKKNSDNLFTRHFVMPGTLLVQVLSTRGKVLPRAGLDHLLLCMGLAGAYGGQTSITGTNIRTHLIGAYAAPFERAETSPYELLKRLRRMLTEPQLRDVDAVTQTVHSELAESHPVTVESAELEVYSRSLIERFEADVGDLREQYQMAAGQVAKLFDSWFGNKKAS